MRNNFSNTFSPPNVTYLYCKGIPDRWIVFLGILFCKTLTYSDYDGTDCLWPWCWMVTDEADRDWFELWCSGNHEAGKVGTEISEDCWWDLKPFTPGSVAELEKPISNMKNSSEDSCGPDQKLSVIWCSLVVVSCSAKRDRHLGTYLRFRSTLEACQVPSHLPYVHGTGHGPGPMHISIFMPPTGWMLLQKLHPTGGAILNAFLRLVSVCIEFSVSVHPL